MYVCMYVCICIWPAKRTFSTETVTFWTEKVKFSTEKRTIWTEKVMD